MAESNAPKPIVKSKVVWTNVVYLVIVFLLAGLGAPEIKSWLSENYPWVAGIQGILNIILRIITTSPIGSPEDQ